MKEISPQELNDILSSGLPMQLYCICESYENETAIAGTKRFSMDEIMACTAMIPKDKPVVIYCRNGTRSKTVIYLLETKFGFTNLLHLQGGYLAYMEDVDPPPPNE